MVISWVHAASWARRRQLAEQDQIGGLEEGALLGQLLDRVAPVHQDALVAVDVGDLAAARRGVHERRVVGGQAEVVRVGLDLAQVHRLDGAVGDRDVVLLAGAVVGDGERIGHDCGTRGPGLGARAAGNGQLSSSSVWSCASTGGPGTRYEPSAQRARSSCWQRWLQNGLQRGSTGRSLHTAHTAGCSIRSILRQPPVGRSGPIAPTHGSHASRWANQAGSNGVGPW